MLAEEVIKKYDIQITGNGQRPLLFAHGLACDSHVWQHVSPAFEQDYKVIVFNYLGSGDSDVTKYSKEKYSSLDGYAQDVQEICETLLLDAPVFVGHSVSSMIGMLTAIKNPEIFSKIIMIGPSPCYLIESHYSGGFYKEDIEQLLGMMKEDYLRWSSYFSPLAMGNKERPELTNKLTQIFCKADPDITCDFARVTFLSDNRKDLPHLTIPTLIMQPADDIVAPKHVGEYVHRNISDSKLRYMIATGHFPHLSAPRETIEMIKDYLLNPA